MIPLLKMTGHHVEQLDLSESRRNIIGKYFRDDEDMLIYKVLTVYKYKGLYAITRGLVLPNNNIQYVNDPIWLGDAFELVESYKKEVSKKLLLIKLPNVISYTSNVYNTNNNNNDIHDVFPLTTESYKNLINVCHGGDNIALHVLEAGVAVTEVSIPSTHKQALKSLHAERWLQAEESEIHSLQKKQVLHACILPDGKSMISTRWIYRIKYHQDGTINVYKARLVARGYEQILGIDYDETFSPVVRLTSLRILFALSVGYNLIIHTMDVDTAFLNAPLEEDIYIKPPAGITLPPGTTCFKLLKALYGLKQSPRAWNLHLNGHLLGMGFTKMISDTCIYLKRYDNMLCIIAIYVDDIVIAASNLTLVNEVKNMFKGRFQMKDLGPITTLLGCRIIQNTTLSTLTMDQSFYAKNILKTFFPEGLTASEVPMLSETNLSSADSPTTQEDKDLMLKFPYRQAIGSLLWLAGGTRPDLSYAVAQVARFSCNPGMIHWKAIVKIFRYLQGTINLGIKYSTSTIADVSTHITITGYADSDHGRCIDTRRSITGYMFLMANGPISWQSRQQTSVALSSMEAEYMALCAAAQEAIWLRMVMNDFNREYNDTVVIYDDNQSCIDYTKNPTAYKRTKHIDQRYHFVKDQVIQNTINVKKVPTEDNIADILTKPLEVKRFQYLLSQFLSRLH